MRRLIHLAILAAFVPAVAGLVACGEGPAYDVITSSCAIGFADVGDGCERVADYVADCDLVTCIGPDARSETMTGDHRLLSCSWRCARFEGATDKAVGIVFETSTAEPCWRVASVSVEEGACDGGF